MKKGLMAGLCAVLCVLMFAITAMADWKEAGRDKWRIIYVDDEIQPGGQGTFMLREKKEFVSEGPRCSCTPFEVIISYAVDAALCKVQSYEMKALDEDGKVMMANSGGEATPEFSLAPYCTIALVKASQVVETTLDATSVQFALIQQRSLLVEP